MIKLYTLPVCPKCVQTKRYLNNAGIKYTEIDLAADDEARTEVKRAGFSQAPVVKDGDNFVAGGFDRDALDKLIAKHN